MHYLTDVSAGALASGIWLTVVLVMLLPTATANRVDRTEGART
jgi:membrane-associated phospholipid phosphatase